MYPDWVEIHRTKGHEIKKFGNNYYLYEYKTVYDKDKKGPKKKSGIYIGKITKNGVIPKKDNSEKTKPLDISAPLEFGATYLLEVLCADILENLKKVFPDDAEALFSLAKQSLIEPSPLRSKNIIYKNSYDIVLHPDLKLSPSSMTRFINKIGLEREKQVNFMKIYLIGEEYIIFDGTRLVSYSDNMQLARIGYNHCNIEDPQINVLYCFSLKPNKAPVYFRANAGDKSDYDTIINAVNEIGINNAVIIADKGFNSEFNLNFLKENNLKYIIPLRRNSKEIDDDFDCSNIAGYDGHFGYHDRIIFFKVLSKHEVVEKEIEKKKGRGRPPKNKKTEYTVESIEQDMVVIYYDDALRSAEYRDYGKRLLNNYKDYSAEDMAETIKRMGTITICSNEEINPVKLYEIYKEREIIEDSNKALKNVLNINDSHMQNDDSYNGWLFISHLSLMMYYRLFNKIKEAGKTSELSVSELLRMLRRITKQKVNGNWITETGTKVELDKIRTIFPEYNT